MPPKPPAKGAKGVAPPPSWPVPVRPAPIVKRLASYLLPSIAVASEFVMIVKTQVIACDPLEKKWNTFIRFADGSTAAPEGFDSGAAKDGTAAAAVGHALIISNGALWAAGSDEFRQTGAPGGPGWHNLNKTLVERMQSQSLQALTTAIELTPLSVACGTMHSLAVLMVETNGARYVAVMSSGYTRDGALGRKVLPSVATSAWSEIESLRCEAIDRVWASGTLSFARGTKGLFLWGRLDNAAEPIYDPILIFPEERGTVTSLVVTNDGADVYFAAMGGSRLFRLHCQDGAVDIQDVTATVLPTVHDGPILSMTSGKRHVVMQLQNGDTYGWGVNSFGQLGADVHGEVAVAAPLHPPWKDELVHAAVGSATPIQTEIVRVPSVSVKGDSRQVTSRGPAAPSQSQAAVHAALTLANAAPLAPVAPPPEHVCTVGAVCCGPWATLWIDGRVDRPPKPVGRVYKHFDVTI